MTPLTPAAVQALAQQAADPPYDPSCLECRRAAGKDAAGTTWQCVGHVYRERDTLRSERDEAREALEVEKTCRDRNWNDLKWVRQALDNECRLSETLTAQRDAALAERDAARATAQQDRELHDARSARRIKRIEALEAERDEAWALVGEWQTAVMAYLPLGWCFDPTAPGLMVANVARASAQPPALTEARRVLRAVRADLDLLVPVAQTSELPVTANAMIRISADIAAVLAQEEK